MEHALNVNVSGHFCNTWPNFQIVVNGTVLFDDEIINDRNINVVLESKNTNLIQFKLTNKTLGENNIWDTQVNELNEIISDKFIKINNVTLDNVDITALIHSSPLTQISDNTVVTMHDGLMNFNGRIEFHFEEPLLNFLINAKYKKEVDTSKSYFSNDTYIFHYDMEIELIDEIRQLLKGNTDE